MALFGDQKIEQVRQATDLVKLVSEFLPLKRSGSRWVGLCPFHNEKSPSFSVNPAMQIFKCFGCGAGGDAFKFLMLKEGLTFPEALRTLAERAGIAVEAAEARSKKPGEIGKTDLFKINEWAVGVYARKLAESPDCGHARRYLADRGVNAASTELFRLGAVPDAWDVLVREAARTERAALPITPPMLTAAGLAMPRQNGGGFFDRFRNRVMFPIFDTLNRCVGFGGRTLGGDPAKYVNSPESAVFSKGRGIFGLNVAKDAIQKSGRAVVVEGYMDCLMPHQHGVGNVVATLGTALTAEQVRLLRRYAEEIVLVFDSDAAGENAADRALDVFLAESVDVRVAAVPSGKDPCDYVLAEGGDAFRRLLDQALPALEFKLQLIRKRMDAAGTLEGRRRAAEELLAAVATGARFEAVDAVRRGLIVADLAKLTDVPVGDLHVRIAAMKAEANRADANRAEARNRTRAGNSGPEPAAAGNPPVGSPISATPPTAEYDPDARLKAERWVLGVLLKHPDYYAGVREMLGAENFRDPACGRLARELFAVLEAAAENAADNAGIGDAAEVSDAAEISDAAEVPEGSAPAGPTPPRMDLAGLLSRLSREPEGDALVGLAEELYALGEAQRDPGATLDAVVQRIRQADRGRLLAEQLARAEQAVAGGADRPLSENEEWLRVAQRLAKRGNNPLARPRVADSPGAPAPRPPPRSAFRPPGGPRSGGPGGAGGRGGPP